MGGGRWDGGVCRGYEGGGLTCDTCWSPAVPVTPDHRHQNPISPADQSKPTLATTYTPFPLDWGGVRMDLRSWTTGKGEKKRRQESIKEEMKGKERDESRRCTRNLITATYTETQMKYLDIFTCNQFFLLHLTCGWYFPHYDNIRGISESYYSEAPESSIW